MLIEFQNIVNKDPFMVATRLEGTTAATAGNYGVFFIAPYPCELLLVAEAHETAGTDGSAVTLQIEKLTGTQALDAGTTLLATAQSLKGTANTVAYPALTTTVTNRQLARGDRLALKDAGTLTSVAGVQVTCVIKPLGKGHYTITKA